MVLAGVAGCQCWLALALAASMVFGCGDGRGRWVRRKARRRSGAKSWLRLRRAAAAAATALGDGGKGGFVRWRVGRGWSCIQFGDRRFRSFRILGICRPRPYVYVYVPLDGVYVSLDGVHAGRIFRGSLVLHSCEMEFFYRYDRVLRSSSNFATVRTKEVEILTTQLCACGAKFLSFSKSKLFNAFYSPNRMIPSVPGTLYSYNRSCNNFISFC